MAASQDSLIPKGQLAEIAQRCQCPARKQREHNRIQSKKRAIHFYIEILVARTPVHILVTGNRCFLEVLAFSGFTSSWARRCRPTSDRSEALKALKA